MQKVRCFTVALSVITLAMFLGSLPTTARAADPPAIAAARERRAGRSRRGPDRLAHAEEAPAAEGRAWPRGRRRHVRACPSNDLDARRILVQLPPQPLQAPAPLLLHGVPDPDPAR